MSHILDRCPLGLGLEGKYWGVGPLRAQGCSDLWQEVEGGSVHDGRGFQELCPEAAQLALACPSPCLILSLQHKREEHECKSVSARSLTAT